MLNISLEGVEKLQKKLTTIWLEKVGSIWVKWWTIHIQGEARKEVPVRDWNLRNQILYRNEWPIGFVEALAPYSIYVHEGTGVYARNGGWRTTPWLYKDKKSNQYFWTMWQRPNPFMERTVDNNREKVVNEYRNILQAYLDKQWLSN